MPLSRYEIRNEYSLADPDLYRAADKDDPEALLEGVAMTGLVGILRQLGDLAEFAAEIFHDLHEDLMATAARGYSLTVRVQQIEAEFPSIEKAFLSQTSHSSFFYNTGVDWHLNVHLNQNLVTQGDLPRFVMDSYEECRGPPRLFLLDKFDVAGAGSCLKRYTDPSFFKAESPLSVMPNAEVQREKKGRKSKKKGSRWRNGETPEVLSTSHVKLQQLLLEERVENHISDPARRVKLKRRLNGSPFNYAMGKSYMDAILKIPPPDLDVVREISITSSPLKMPTSVAAETENEVLEITAINPDKNMQQRKRSTYSSSDSEAGYKPSIHPLTEEYSEISPNFSSTQRGDVLSTPHEVYTKEIISEGVRKKNEYQSDDEVDNYVDALTSMDSEMETDSEYRAKNGTSFLKVNDRGIGSDATEELSDMQTNSTDNHSIGNSSLMDGVNSSSRKEKSTFSYSGSFDLAENTPSEGDASANTIQSAEHREAELVNSSSDGYSCNRNTPSTHLQRHIIQDNACNDNGNKNSSSYNSEFGEPSSGSHLSESGIVLLPADPVAHFVEVSSLGLELDKIYSNHSNSRDRYVNNEENSIHLDKSIPWTSNYGDLAFQTEDTGFSKLSLNSIDELNDQGTHKYHASLHLQSVLQLSSDNNRNEDLKNNIMQGEFLEKEDVLNSVASPIQSRSTFSSQKEEHTEKEIETCSLCVVTEENASEGMDCLGTVDLADMQLQDSESNHSVDLGMRFSHSQEVKLDWPSSSRADGEAKDGSSSGNDLVDLVPKNNDETNFASVRNFPYSQHTVGVSLDDGIKDTYHLQAKDVATAVAKTNLDGNGGDATSLDTRSMKLQGKCSLVLQDLHQNGLKFDDHISESSLEEMFKEHADVSSKRLPCDDYSDLDLLHRLSGSFNGESSGNNSHVKQGNAVISSYQNPKDAEAKAVQKINVIEKEEDAQSSPTCDLAETSTIQGPQVKLYNGQFDSESWNEQILEPKSTHHAVVVKDTEEVLSSSENFLADVSTYDQKVEPHNDNMDVTCCHATHDQVSELKYVHQTDNMEEEGISSLSHHVAELRTSPEENFELHRDQIDLESSYDQVSQSTSAQHIDFFENATDSMSPPTHHHAELGATLEQKDEAPRDNQPDMTSWHDQSFEPEHVQQIEATGSLETAPSSDIYYITELTTHIDQTCRLEEHFDENSRPTNNANMVPLSLMLEGESLTPNNPESETYPSSEVSARHLPSQPSLFVSQFSVPKPAEDPLSSKVSAFGCLPKASLEEIPPLLPLPPHAIPGPEESLLKHNLHSVPKSVSSNEAKSPSGHPATEAEDSHPSNPFSRNFSFENNNSQDMNVNEADNLVPSVNPLLRPVPELVEIASRMPDTPQDLVLPVHHCLKCEDVLLDSNEGILEQDVKLFSPPTTVEESPSALPFCSFSEKTVEPLNQSAPSTSSNLDDKIQGEPIVSEEKNVNCPTTDVSVPVIHVYEKQPVLSTSGEKATWTSSSSLSLASSKDGMENGNEKIKLPRPRNPLIDAVVAHDKSKLRKVTQLPQPLIGKKAVERDSLLEQIRAKSFNLKPAVVTRPSIQGPKTNLRLAAILEKANAIRQAFAGNGSDEDDDEDGWSDS